MRIIAGTLKGRRFNAKLPEGIRPTTDSNKESIFNMLNNLIDFDGANVCDICAGSGNLGFETLSRGSEYCTFVDISSKSLKYIDSAAHYFGINKECYECIKSDALKFLEIKLPANTGLYDLIFVDPPYENQLVNQIVNKIIQGNYLTSAGLIIAESAIGDGITITGDYEIVKHRIFGETQFHIIQRSE